MSNAVLTMDLFADAPCPTGAQLTPDGLPVPRMEGDVLIAWERRARLENAGWLPCLTVIGGDDHLYRPAKWRIAPPARLGVYPGTERSVMLIDTVDRKGEPLARTVSIQTCVDEGCAWRIGD